MFRGSEGKCKCLPVIVGPMLLPPLRPIPPLMVVEEDDSASVSSSSSLSLVAFNKSIVVVALGELALPLLAVFNVPSAVISHEEMMREARIYSLAAPALGARSAGRTGGGGGHGEVEEKTEELH